MKLDVNNLSFAYPGGEKILQNVSMQVSSGEVISVLGPNGAGKTTLLKCLLGFRKPSAGEILLDGRDISEWKDQDFWKICAYVPQARVQAFPYTVRETVLMGRSVYLKLFQTPRQEDLLASEDAMRIAGILHLADCSCAEISGGELQLVLIARALAQKPQILIMDEPETGLDYRNQLMILQLIRKLSKEKGITILFNTHYPEHAYSVSDHCLLLKKRQGFLFGTPEEVLNEENMLNIFGVHVIMRHFEADGESYVSMIPVSIADPLNT